MVRITLLLFLFFAATTQCQQRHTVAMLDLEVPESISGDISVVLSNLIRQEFLKVPQYDVVDRSNMSAILKEQDFTLSSDCSGSACAVEVGKLLGVEKMLFGSVGTLGKKFLIDIKMVDVTTGRIEKIESDSYVGQLEDLDRIVSGLARKLATGQQVENTDTRAHVYVTSDPEGAKIYVGEKLMGSTPVTLTFDSEDAVRVMIKAQDYQDWYQDVVPKKGRRSVVNAPLMKLTGAVADFPSRYRLYDEKKLAPGVATLWAVPLGFAGAGHFYANSHSRGLIIAGSSLVGLIVAKQNGLGVFLIGAAWAYDIYGSRGEVRKYNNQLKTDLNLGITPVPGLDGAAVHLSFSF